jgi:hypothetical protein
MTARTQEYPLWDEPLVWKVLEVSLSDEAKRFGPDRVTYPFHVGGINLSHPFKATFRWNVPDLNDPRYDMSIAVMDENTRAAIARARRSK